MALGCQEVAAGHWEMTEGTREWHWGHREGALGVRGWHWDAGRWQQVTGT